ncbi:hypothetical protein [Cellulomonas iranensis]|uniref:hypothetical protein n=1 Tax=Cellulomonas iranensis TaxID=76862 RepID=UPI0013CF57F1|nr:hypothetical protein [Cellulomonas iranensis]
MDPWTAAVTLAVAAIALLPRVPALSADGRKTARLKQDADLWSVMPDGEAKAALGQHITKKTSELLEERHRDRFVEQSWSAATAFAVAALILANLLNLVDEVPAWAVELYASGELAVGILAVLSLLFFGMSTVVGGVRAAKWAMRRAERRRSPGAEGYSI